MSDQVAENTDYNDQSLISDLVGAMDSDDRQAVIDSGLHKESPEATTEDADAASETETEQADDKADADKKDAKAKEGDDDKSGDDEPDDYFEIASDEEGGEPQRVKASDVWQGYQEAQTLRTELEELKASAENSGQLQPDHEQVLQELVQQSNALTEAIERWQVQNPITEPDPDLLDVNSDKYDPSAYQRQLLQSQIDRDKHAQAEAELAKAREQSEAEQAKIVKAHMAREQAALKAIWPEMLTDQSVKFDFAKSMIEHYKLDAETLSELTDHRFFAIAKDALAYRAAQAKTENAVKVVRSKPKLVKGGGRETDSKSASRSAQLDKLKASGGTDEDAIMELADSFIKL